MRRRYYDEYLEYPRVRQSVFVGDARRSRRYGLAMFMGDLILTAMTGGLWLIWVIIRELR